MQEKVVQETAKEGLEQCLRVPESPEWSWRAELVRTASQVREDTHLVQMEMVVVVVMIMVVVVVIKTFGAL